MEYTLENVKCPECGHRAYAHFEDSEMERVYCIEIEKDGFTFRRCRKTMADILLHHLNAVAKERDTYHKHLGDNQDVLCTCSEPGYSAKNCPYCDLMKFT